LKLTKQQSVATNKRRKFKLTWGGPRKLTEHQQREAFAGLACGEETLVEIARNPQR
jgi:hypothetical protein